MSSPVQEFEQRFSAFLAQLGDLDVEALLSVLQSVTLDPGEAAITEGQPHDAILLVEWGALDVIVDGDRVAQMGPGDVAGEVGLLAPGQATATVRATAPTLVHVLSHTALDGLWSSHPAVASSVIQGVTRVIAGRIREIEGDVDRLHEHERHGLLSMLGKLFRRAA